MNTSETSPRFWHDLVLPVLLFGFVYFAVFLAGVLGLFRAPEVVFHSVALAAALVATVVANRVFDKGRWTIGFTGGMTVALRELALGLLFAAAIIGAIDLLIIATTGFDHDPGRGIDWMLLLTLFLPAAVHEEVLMRGYAFQKFVAWNRWVGVFACSGMFALLHMTNSGLTGLAVVNLFLAGVLLSLAYLVFHRLWLPVGLHVFWNIFSGPVLGHEVSGLQLRQTLLTANDPGPSMLTGGPFGLEGSIWATVVEVIAIAILLVPAARSARPEPVPHPSVEQVHPSADSQTSI